MKKVLIIGNNAGGKRNFDGGSIKVRLYKQCLEHCGVHVILLDLFKWQKHLFSKLFFLLSNIRKCDCILIMGGPKGSRLLIPLINFLNVFNKKRVVYCPLGIGTIEGIIKKLDSNQTHNFINCVDFYGIKDKRMAKHLAKMSQIIPQNDTLSTLYKKYYNLNNVSAVLNFRDIDIIPRIYSSHSPFRIIYLSRVTENKGIFLLLNCVKDMKDVELSIYGEKQFSKEENLYFESFLKNNNIHYFGPCDSAKSISIMREHDLFCLPTKYKGEGTSGAFIESLIAGTPVLLSSYSQANELVMDGKNGFIFQINNLEDLKKKISFIKSIDLRNVSEKSQELAKRYTFEYNKNDFMRTILG